MAEQQERQKASVSLVLESGAGLPALVFPSLHFFYLKINLYLL